VQKGPIVLSTESHEVEKWNSTTTGLTLLMQAADYFMENIILFLTKEEIP
jgi:hypothetical protein